MYTHMKTSQLGNVIRKVLFVHNYVLLQISVSQPSKSLFPGFHMDVHIFSVSLTYLKKSIFTNWISCPLQYYCTHPTYVDLQHLNFWKWIKHLFCESFWKQSFLISNCGFAKRDSAWKVLCIILYWSEKIATRKN